MPLPESLLHDKTGLRLATWLHPMWLGKGLTRAEVIESHLQAWLGRSTEGS